MMPGILVQSPVDNRGFHVKQLLSSGSAPSHLVLLAHAPVDQLIDGALHMGGRRIQVPHSGECLADALRGFDAPGENLKLMPLARPSMPCFNEGAIDSHHQS